jgi:hypothetical protein
VKELVIDFRTNYKGADYNGKVYHVCKDKEDLIAVQRMLWDYLQKYIEEEQNNNAGMGTRERSM